MLINFTNEKKLHLTYFNKVDMQQTAK